MYIAGHKRREFAFKGYNGNLFARCTRKVVLLNSPWQHKSGIESTQIKNNLRSHHRRDCCGTSKVRRCLTKQMVSPKQDFRCVRNISRFCVQHKWHRNRRTSQPDDERIFHLMRTTNMATKCAPNENMVLSLNSGVFVERGSNVRPIVPANAESVSLNFFGRLWSGLWEIHPMTSTWPESQWWSRESGSKCNLWQPIDGKDGAHVVPTHANASFIFSESSLLEARKLGEGTLATHLRNGSVEDWSS